MNIILTIVCLTIFFTCIYSETNKETESTSPTTTVKGPPKELLTTDSKNLNSNLNSLWLYKPLPRTAKGSEESEAYHFLLQSPRLVTKLTKTYAFGFDPYFNKGYFEPFEKRPKPVTLVAFRKNGFAPRMSIKIDNDKSLEIAELQSPFNHISYFWPDQPGEPES